MQLLPSHAVPRIREVERRPPATHVLVLFPSCWHHWPMSEPPLRPATAEEIGESLSFALRYEARRRVHTADEAMARITAERLVEHLRLSGFVLMKRPPARAR